MEFELEGKSNREKLEIAEKLWKKVMEFIIERKRLPVFRILHDDGGTFSDVTFRPVAAGVYLDVFDYEFLIKLFVFDERTKDVSFDETDGTLFFTFVWEIPSEEVDIDG